MRLFCYGTLLIPEVMHRVTGSHFDGIEASLDDYGCYIVNGHTFPGIVRETGSVTQGAVYAGMGDSLLRKLDRYEGDIYERIRVCVSDQQGRPMQAWAYVIPAARQEVISDRPWDRQAFERERLKTYLRTVLPD